jgi:hypothetical protein
MQIDAKQHQHSAAAAAKVILYQYNGELYLLEQYTADTVGPGNLGYSKWTLF